MNRTENERLVREIREEFVRQRGYIGLEEYSTLLEDQIQEINEHLEDDDQEQVLREFVDCLMLCHGAIFEHSDVPEQVIGYRLLDLLARVDDISEREIGGGA